jgi:hypothetical protein
MDRQTPHLSPQLISIVDQASFSQFDQGTWNKNAMKKPLTNISGYGARPFGFKELTLRQMLLDPIVQDLMRADKVSTPDVLKAFGSINYRCAVLAA